MWQPVAVALTLLSVLAAPLTADQLNPIAFDGVHRVDRKDYQIGDQDHDDDRRALAEWPARLNVSSVSLEDGLSKLSQVSGVPVAFSPSRVQGFEGISCACQDVTVGVALERLLQGTPFVFTEMPGRIVVARRENERVEPPTVEYPAALNNLAASPYLPGTSKLTLAPPAIRQGTVSGRVTERITQRPLSAVRVAIAGTTFGAFTNTDGRFEINNVPAGAVRVEVILVGYVAASQQVEVTSGVTVTVNFELDTGPVALDELVVVGYGTVQRRDLTGSVGSIGSAEIREMPVTRVDEALLGKVAGVEVISYTGAPGAGPRIRVRGVGSITAGSSPLYVVDGHPTESIEMLNPNDIETIDILKDASATAIYGSRGANGVVLITTKRGSSGTRPDIRVDVRNSWQRLASAPEFLTAREQAEYYIYSIRSRNVDGGHSVAGPPETWVIRPPQTVIDVMNGVNTTDVEALDHIFRVAPVREVNLSAAGTAGDFRYALSAGYLDEEGVVIESSFNRLTLRANVDGQLSSRLRVGVSTNLGLSESSAVNDGGGGGGENTSIIAQAASWQRYYPVYNPDGSYFAMQGVDASTVLFNPVALAREHVNRGQQNNGRASVNLDFSLTDDISFRQMLGGTSNVGKNWHFRPGGLEVFGNQQALGTDGVDISTNWISESTMHYDRSFLDHSFSGMTGFTAQRNMSRSNSVSSNNYPNNLIQTLNSAIITGGSSSMSEWALVSFLGRLNYDFRSRYYVTASLRTDGSSRFGANRKYAAFPSAALAWRVSEEGFMQNLLFLNDLKLRASYGRTGNDNIGLYQDVATIGSQSYTLGRGQALGYAPSRQANPDLTWEKQAQYNVGVDVELLDSRLRLNVDHYRSWSESLLLSVPVPRITGFNNALQNIGTLKNQGWEFALNTVNLQRGRFLWTSGLNLSTNRNEVVALGPEGAPIISGNQITMIGQPMGMHYGLQVQGIFLNAQQLAEGPIYNPGAADRSRIGDIRFVDQNGDGVVTLADDRVIIGNPYPDFYFGMTQGVAWRNLSLNLNLQGTYGNVVRNQNNVIFLLTRSRSKTLATQRNFWRSEEEPGDGVTPRPNDATTGGIRLHSERYLEDGSYLRVNNVNLNYTLPAHLANRMGSNSMRLYFNATNPLTLTRYTGWNPAAASSASSLTPGVDQYQYPLAKMLSIGVDMGF